MKKLMGMMSALAMASAAAYGGISDRVVVFSTPGPDRYADGSKVLDGECYALVWSPAGEVFGGFNADGTAVNAADRVVLAGALAKNGKCMEAIFQVPEEEYKELSGGEWAVCLLDTRRQDGSLAGVVDGKPQRVNRWAIASAGEIRAENGAAQNFRAENRKALSAASESTAAATSSGVRASSVSAVPPGVMPPKIIHFAVSDDEIALTVGDTVPYLSYTLTSGSSPGELKTDCFADVVDGDAGAQIVISTAKSSNRRFFRVERAK